MCVRFVQLLDFTSSVLMLFKNKVFLQQIITAVISSDFFFLSQSCSEVSKQPLSVS